MNKLIAYFEYHNYKFFIILNDNKQISFFKAKDDGSLSSALSQEEYNIVKKVYNSLLVSPKTSVFIKNITVNNSLYNLYYDPTASNYFWTPINGMYNVLDNTILNFRYNHQSDILYSYDPYAYDPYSAPQNPYYVQSPSPKKPPFFKKLLSIGGKIVVVAILGSVAFNIITNCLLSNDTDVTLPPATIAMETTFQQTEPAETIEFIPETTPVETIENTEATEETIFEETEPTESFEQLSDYNWEEIREYIANNPNLSDTEKEILYSLKFVFDEHHQYMNLNLVKLRLALLKIEYGFTEEDKKEHPNASGFYSASTNTIKFKCQSLDEVNLGTFIHEVGHLFQDYYEGFSFELSNSKWTNEVLLRLYFDNLINKRFFLNAEDKKQFDSGNLSYENNPQDFLNKSIDSLRGGYDWLMPIYCILSDLVPSDIMIEYHFRPTHTDDLVNELMRIDLESNNGSTVEEAETRAYQLITCINELKNNINSSNITERSYDLTECLDILNHYYLKAKGRSINATPEYYLLFSGYERYSVRGDYFFDSLNLIDDYFRPIISMECDGYYWAPSTLYSQPLFGYSEKHLSGHLIIFPNKCYQTSDSELMSELGDHINEYWDRKIK